LKSRKLTLGDALVLSIFICSAYPLVRQENITNRSAPQSGHRMRAALRSPHETASVHEGEPAFRIAAVEVAPDDLLDDRPEVTALIRFAPEDCKARTLSRNESHTQSGTCRNDGTAPGRGRSAPDAGDDRLLPWRENGLKKQANATDKVKSP